MKYPVLFVHCDGRLFAGADGRRITISTEMVDLVGFDLVRGVIAHEEGHLEYQHRNWSAAIWLAGFLVYVAIVLPALTQLSAPLFAACALWAACWWFLCAVHDHIAEFRADAYAVSHGHGERLIAVFKKIHPGLDYHWSTRSHPSPRARVERIERLLRGA